MKFIYKVAATEAKAPQKGIFLNLNLLVSEIMALVKSLLSENSPAGNSPATLKEG